VDRRFFAWMLLTLSLFMLWQSMQQRAALKQKEEQLQAERREERKKREADEMKARAEKAQATSDVPAPPVVPEARYTLGSMNPNDNYSLLVTLTNRGAGVERIELVEQTKPGRFRFRSLAERGGYLGYLAGEKVDAGLRIRNVAPGTPAALANCESGDAEAGLLPEDVLTKVDQESIVDELQLERILATFKPRSKVKLTVSRPAEGAEPRTLIFSAELTEPPLDVVRMQDDLPREGIPGNRLRASLMTSLAKVDGIEAIPGNETIPGLEANFKETWSAKPLEVENGTGIEFSMPLQSYLAANDIEANLELVKRYRVYQADRNAEGPLSPRSLAYHLDVETVVRNLGDQAHEVAFRQESVNGLTLEAWWYAIKLSQTFTSAAGARDVMMARKSGAHELITRREIQEYARSHPDQPDNPFFGPDFPIDKRSFRYLGVDQQYFSAAFLPHPASPDSLDALTQGATRAVADMTESKPYKDIGTNTAFWFDSPVMKVEPKAEASKRYQVFVGPKDASILDAYGLSGSVYYGWTIFEFVAKPLSWLLHGFFAIVRNYGIAIMMLTVLVRSCMFPLSRRAAVMGQRMQEMQPEMKRLNELYKDDRVKLGQEMQALYKKYNLNPMASCLPVFVQIPIFMGLYRCVSTDIELRQQPLIPGLDWCTNLAGPDMLTAFPSWMPDFIAGKGTGWFGPYFNVLPIVTIALFIIQQKVLMPKATDEQTRMTQQMMMFMTIFMGVLFFKVPAGLCIYFVTSSTWSLVERRLIKKFVPSKQSVEAEANIVAAKPASPMMPARSKSSSKPPETWADIMSSMKDLWSKNKSRQEPAKPVASPADRRKQRKRKP
jgi:YidC/Oxa1 family membrane protein insertase